MVTRLIRVSRVSRSVCSIAGGAASLVLAAWAGVAGAEDAGARDLGAPVDLGPRDTTVPRIMSERVGAVATPVPLRLKAGVRPGEAFLYTLSVGSIVGARARMSVGRPVTRDGHSLVAVQGEAETTDLVRLVAPVTASYVTTIDLGTLLPRDVLSTEKGLRDRSYQSTLQGNVLDQELRSTLRNAKTKRTLPRELRDPLSAYFALRAQELASGTEMDFDVLDGAAVWRTHMKVVGLEQINPREGEENAPPTPKVNTIHLEGTLFRIDDLGRAITRIPKRVVSCWLSDDRDRILVLARFDTDLGRAELRLTTYLPAKQTTKLDGKLAPTSLPGFVRTAPPQKK